MESKNLSELREALASFAQEREWDQFHTVKNLILALVGEVGELSEIFQWLDEKQISNLSEADMDRAKEEVADVFLYLIRLSDKLDIDLIEAANSKLRLNAEKYPVDASKGNAVKYNRR